MMMTRVHAVCAMRRTTMFLGGRFTVKLKRAETESNVVAAVLVVVVATFVVVCRLGPVRGICLRGRRETLGK